MATRVNSGTGGRIVTFYSYKGGTGRSMAVANVAWILASNGLRVLVLDWDLEAPGLHRYFHPFLIDKELVNTSGIIDFIVDFAAAALNREEDSPDWYWSYANLLRNAVSLDWSFPDGGTLDFVPAGRQDSGYAVRVNSFNWQQFYDQLGGGVFLEAVKTRLREEYDYILIDSRTGISDTSGVCTVQMPDELVVCFTLNHQSIEGASAAAASAMAQRRKADDSYGLVIWPVPMRVELFEKQKLELARDVARGRFDRFLWMLSPAQRGSYWGQVEVPYQPFYAYEEILASFADRPGHSNSMLAAMERLAYCITTGTITELRPMSEEQRIGGSSRYSRQPGQISYQKQDYLYAISYAESDWDDAITRFQDDLMTEVRVRTGDAELQGFLPVKATSDVWGFDAEQKFRDSQVLICLLTPGYIASTKCAREVNLFRDRRKPVIPIPWVAARAAGLPELQDLLFYQEQLPPRYGTQDVRDLVRIEKQSDNYHSFLGQLAIRASRLSQKAASPQIDSNVLSITVCVLVITNAEAGEIPGSGDLYGNSVEAWFPFTEGYRISVSDILRRIATERRLPLNILSIEAMIELGEERSMNTKFIVILDAWSLTVRSYAESLAWLDSLGATRSVWITCVDLGGERKEKQYRLRTVLDMSDDDVNRYYVYDYDALEDAIISALGQISSVTWQP